MHTGLAEGALNMTYSKSLLKCPSVSGLPLFDCRQVVVQPPRTRAGLHLVHCFRVHPTIADDIANFAGLGSNPEAD